MTVENCRLYVGNLPDCVREEDITKKFSKYNVSNVELKQKNESTFAFVNVSADVADKCISHFQNKKWKGCHIKIESAKESFVSRLKKEIEERKTNLSNAVGTLDCTQFKVNKESSSKHKQSIRFPKFKGIKSISEADLDSDCYVNVEKLISHTTSYPDLINNSYLGKENSNFECIKEKLNATCEWDRKEAQVVEEESKHVQEHLKKEGEQKQSTTNTSDLKRLQAIEEKKKEFETKRRVIQESLKTGQADLNRPNKRIRFDDDSDDADHETGTCETKQKTVTLFDSSSSDDDFTPDFETALRFQGKKAKELLKLKTRLEPDERFKLDKRFLEDGIEEENKPEFHETNDEVQKQLNILSSIVGPLNKNHSNVPREDSRNLFPSIKRYDPANPEHQKYVKMQNDASDNKPQKKKKKTLKKENISREESKALEEDKTTSSSSVTPKEKYFSVADNIKEAFGKNQEFSLMKLFEQKSTGESEIINETAREKTEERITKKPVIPKHISDMLGQHDLSEDDSDNESDEKPVQVPLVTFLPLKQDKPDTLHGVWRETFFFRENDPRLQDADQFFAEKEGNVDFDKIRDKLREIFKRKEHNSLKAKREFDQNAKGRLNKKKFRMRLKKLRRR